MIRGINKMNITKSTRSDVPKTKFLKLSKDIVAPFLALIFNKCIEEGVFPTSLKIAEIVPIYKSGKRTESNNYRPISLLSPFAKLFESQLYTQLNQFFSVNKLIYKKQYGFQKKVSTELALSSYCDLVSKEVDNKKVVCSVFLDLAKAFNTVDPDILLSKLNRLGVSGIPLELMRSYLTERKQYTKTNNATSTIKRIQLGVTQGSALGPLLFLIYVNDLPASTNLDVRLYADDACITFSHEDHYTVQKTINKELVKVSNWLRHNKLFLNYKKSTYLIMTNQRSTYKFSFQVDGNILSQSKNTKYLGVRIDDRFTWQDHIIELRSKLARNNNALVRLRKFVNLNTLKMVYYSLVYSHIQYCISIWGSAAKTNLYNIETLQRQSLRIICFKPYRALTDLIFKTLRILKVCDIHKLQLGKLMFCYNKNLHNREENLTQVSQTHNYNTRIATQNNYYQPERRTSLGQQAFSYIGPSLWRTIPLDIKKSANLNIFKIKYKEYLLAKY